MNTLQNIQDTLQSVTQSAIATMTSPSLPKTYKAAFFEKANSPLVIKDVELKMPGAGQVLVKVLASGVCKYLRYSKFYFN